MAIRQLRLVFMTLAPSSMSSVITGEGSSKTSLSRDRCTSHGTLAWSDRYVHSANRGV